MLTIGELRKSEEAEYSDWLLENERSLIYYSPEYHRFLARAVGGACTVLAARAYERIVGALPFFRMSHPTYGTLVNSLPWYGSHGGCILPVEGADGARQELVGQFARIVYERDVLAATVILSPDESAFEDHYRAWLKPAATDVRIGQMTGLPAATGDPETGLEAVLQQKTRNLVRKARKQGFVECVCNEDWAWDFLYRTHVDNMTAIGGKPKPLAHFEAIRTVFPPRMRRLSVAMRDNLPVAAMLLLQFNKTIEYLTPVIVHDYRPLQPLSFLIWEGMLAAVRSGYRTWNWGGTWASQTSLHHFKAGWGAKDRRYVYLTMATDAARARVKARYAEMLSAFPYYYLYPSSALAS